MKEVAEESMKTAAVEEYSSSPDNLLRKNYSGSAGKMEVDGMLRIFNRSEKLHNLKYSNYIGDGDTKTFNALSENKPYGDDYFIQKIECVGHVQKRMGRLTDSLIDKLAHYYGNAIRCNSTSVKEMRKAIWAVWGHSCSTDDEPIHWFCPTNPNTWCKYNAAINNNLQNYKHKPSVAKAVQDVIKPVFADLSHPALLKKCLGDGDRFNSCQVIYSQFGLAIHQNDHRARRRFVEWAQNEIAGVPDFHKRIFFSDEAHFWLNGYVNKQNCRIWSEANPQVYVETPLHPEKLTVWCALWAGGILLQKR
ncbi:uncharacterized protein TNCV_4371711 [Trichonephila clavipes]|nr:uncharacterized protein TNCV_4371711 [Trichonephila clavipes]